MKNGICKIGSFGFFINSLNLKYKIDARKDLYLAPEIITGEYNDFKSNIWAIGVVYFFILFKGYPYKLNDHDCLETIEKISTNGLIDFQKLKFAN